MSTTTPPRAIELENEMKFLAKRMRANRDRAARCITEVMQVVDDDKFWDIVEDVMFVLETV